MAHARSMAPLGLSSRMNSCRDSTGASRPGVATSFGGEVYLLRNSGLAAPVGYAGPARRELAMPLL